MTVSIEFMINNATRIANQGVWGNSSPDQIRRRDVLFFVRRKVADDHYFCS